MHPPSRVIISSRGGSADTAQEETGSEDLVDDQLHSVSSLLQLVLIAIRLPRLPHQNGTSVDIHTYMDTNTPDDQVIHSNGWA